MSDYNREKNTQLCFDGKIIKNDYVDKLTSLLSNVIIINHGFGTIVAL